MGLTRTFVRPWVRWGLSAALVAASAWPAFFATFHYWAAGGPPTPEPYRSWHEAWGNLFAAGMLALWASAALCVWVFRRPKPQP